MHDHPHDTKNDALIQLFEKLGVPLVNAITAVRLWHDVEGSVPGQLPAKDDSVAYATTLAALLNRSVALSTTLTEKLELQATTDEKHRLDLAAVSTLMVAHQYALMARVPDETDVPKIMSSFESVLSFADYFSADDAMKAKGAKPEDLLVLCLDAVVPLVQTVGRFAFGRTQKTLITEILDELGKRVESLMRAFGQDMKNRDLTLQKIQILKGCAQLLTLCYEAEMNTLLLQSGGDAITGAGASIDEDKMRAALGRIWDNFDSRVTLLRAVLGFVNDYFTGDAQDGKGGKGLKPAEQAAPQAQKAPAAPSSIPGLGIPGLAKPADAPQAAPAQGGGFNPMSFFASPKDDQKKSGT